MILCSGCFDGLHAGHVAYLEAARQYTRDGGELLVVAVACDEYIRREKGREPHWPLADRMRTIAALRCVDRVVRHGPYGAEDAIDIQRPRLFVKGADWRCRSFSPGVDNALFETKCEVVYVDTPGKHTSDALSAHQ